MNQIFIQCDSNHISTYVKIACNIIVVVVVVVVIKRE